MNEDEAQPPCKISSVLEAHRGENHVIVLQDYPDPDAISSGLAHQLIAGVFDIECDMVYGGKISHPENIALVKLLGIEVLRFDPSSDWTKYAGAVFVDNQGTTAEETVNHLERSGVPTLIVVDHHELQQRLKPEFIDIRRNFGSTATIYTEYLERGPVQLNKSHREHVVAATALTHGIMTDTNGLVTAHRVDFHAAGFLSDFRDEELLLQIMSQSRSKRTMEIIHRGLGNRLIVEGFSIAGVGYLRAEDRDVIPQTAEFLVSEENVHTAIVYGVVSGADREESITGSLRTTKMTLDPDEFIKDALGKNASGCFYGGGKETAGGFLIPIGFLSGGGGEKLYEHKWQVFDEMIKQKLFTKIGVGNAGKEMHVIS